MANRVTDTENALIKLPQHKPTDILSRDATGPIPPHLDNLGILHNLGLGHQDDGLRHPTGHAHRHGQITDNIIILQTPTHNVDPPHHVALNQCPVVLQGVVLPPEDAVRVHGLPLSGGVPHLETEIDPPIKRYLFAAQMLL